MTGEHLLDALDPEQKAVATQVTGPLSVLAGAGTGKTRAITYRLAYGIAQGAFAQNSVLAVTFTQRAAREMQERLRGLGVPSIQARTFHAAALRQLRYFWPYVVGGDVPEIAKYKVSLLVAACQRLGIGADRLLLRDLAAEVEWAKVSMLSPEAYLARVQAENRALPGDLDGQTLADLLKVYEGVKTEAGQIDFEDVLLLLIGIMEDNPQIARQIRNQYRHFVVDEFQDVSPLQYHLLNQWLGGRHDICVVGDVAQTIYSFTGATPKYLLNFEKDHPGARRVELNRNYRSTPQIVSLANQVLRERGNRRGELPAGSVQLVSQNPSGPAVTFNQYETDEDEATQIATTVKNLLAAGERLEDMAVLYRTNAQSEAFEHAFSEAGISFVLHGGPSFFERPEVKQAMVELRRQARVAQQILATPEASLVEIVESIITPLGWTAEAPKTLGAVRERWEGLDALRNLALQNPAASLVDFAADLSTRMEQKDEVSLAGITLSSLHAAKGLEWGTVFLIGAAEGLLPISLATTASAVEEEKRLLYVGVTRARQRLYISYARARAGGRSQKRRVSRFLSAVWPVEAPAGSAGGSSAGSSAGYSAGSRGAKSGKATGPLRDKLKAEIAQFTETETALFEQLKAWRKAEAEERSVPAFVVFPDSTLVDIVKAQPKNLTQLRVIRGVGQVKIEAFGTALLRIVKQARNASAQANADHSADESATVNS